MTNDQEENQGNRSRGPLALAILLVFASMIFTTLVYQRNPGLMRDLGMTELPWITVQYIRAIEILKAYWFVIGPVFFAAAFLAWKISLGRPSKGITVAVVVFALLIPIFGYVALEKPLVELEKKLHPAQHPYG